MTRWLRVGLWVIVGLAIMFALGAYNKSISAGERGGFVMNFPATGTEVGGSSPRALTGSLIVPLDKMGVIKRLLQPNEVDLAAHVVKNVGDKPLRIRYQLDGVTNAEVKWDSRDKAWNPRLHGYDRTIAPGESVDIDIALTYPRPLPDTPVLTSAKLAVVDASTGKALSVLPIHITQSPDAAAAAAAGGSCCE